MDKIGHSDQQKPSPSFPSRFSLSRILPRRDGSSSGSSEDTRGPYGLTTIFAPSEPVIADLLFVHGLGGGSRSTWTKSSDASLFWPKEWLPQDAEFKDVRIHTFGYNSNWREESILNIHDFAQSLLGAIQDCPAIPQGSETPLVLVGHSMGGLVIKKAYILSQQFKEFESLARRVRAIYFLATPHRGADIAQTLTKILYMVPGDRPFLQDLHRNSAATKSINDEFPRHCKDLQLFSFYEILPMNYGIGRGLIVSKDSATLGYANERIAYLDANHREVCKYNTLADPNYLTVRNALASTIKLFRKQAFVSEHDFNTEQRRCLENFLGVSHAPEDDLMVIDNLRIRGTCTWLLEKESFQGWRDSTEAQLYWVTAKPATGKSVLAGFIIKNLKDLGLDCSFYFFTYGDKFKATIGAFLRSMAWQMASMHPKVLKIVLEIHEKDNDLVTADYRTFWRKVFLGGIFQVKFSRPQYWVVDALDECDADSDLIPLLLKVSEMCCTHILVTSRNKYESHTQIVRQKIHVVSEEISPEDTKADISLYLEAYMGYLPSFNENTPQTIVATILTKSSGCFLWVCLVVQELRQVHTLNEIRQVLEAIPSDMDELYLRILNSMSKAPYGKILTKSILTWAVCSSRSLTTEEMYHAIQIDIKDNIDSVQNSIMASCGQLVYIDPQSRIHMVHQTARDFLLRSDNTSEFAVSRKSGHKQLAMTCLDYLNGSEMKGPRIRKLGASTVVKMRCAFVDYACKSLFEHLAHVLSTDDDLLYSLEKFFCSSNVLTWIEYLAQNSDLNCVIQTSRALKNFLYRRSKHMPPFGKGAAILETWATDLIRLVTKFGKDLLNSPSSIFHLIPPFCPLDTTPKKQFAISTHGISVLGLSATTWDDSVSTIVHQGERIVALACSNKYFAIGMYSGQLIVYDETTCLEIQKLQHYERVKILKFGDTGQFLASAGRQAVRLWNVTSWQEIWKLDITRVCMSLVFTDADKLMLAALENNRLMIWDLTTGLLRDCADWTGDLNGLTANGFSGFSQPVTAAFCMHSNLLAVVYKGQDIILWDLEGNSIYETYNKETGAGPGENFAGRGVTGGLVFSSDSNANLLAASYSDGDLVLFDTYQGIVKEVTCANAHTLASSNNGHILATGNSSGTVQLFDFKTLKLLYRIKSEDHGIRSLTFSGDDHRMIDIRGPQCRVWDPMVLVRQDVDDESSGTVSVSTAPQEFRLGSIDDVILITSLAYDGVGDVFFCGKDDGSVYLYETRSAQQTQKLFSHASGAPILSLFFDAESQTLYSIDISSRVIAHKLVRQQKAWEAIKGVFDHRAGVAVGQFLSNRGNTRVLLCSAAADELFSITPNGSTIVKTIQYKDRGPYRWGSHPSNTNQLILITNNAAHLYDWQTLRELTGAEGIPLAGSILPELAIRPITASIHGTFIAAAFNKPLGSNSKSKLLLWNTSDLSVGSGPAAPILECQYPTEKIDLIIGTYGHRLVFLLSSRWICSADPTARSIDDYLRHFFIPSDWLNTTHGLMVEVSPKGDIIFVKRDEVAVIRRGLETSEPGSKNSAGKRPSLLGGNRAITVP